MRSILSNFPQLNYRVYADLTEGEQRLAVSSYVENLLKNAGSWETPVPITEAVLPAFAIQLRRASVATEGYVTEQKGTLTINLGMRNTYYSELRRRFTIAHELAHILTSAGPQRIATNLKRTSLELIRIERLCNMVAAELLMPRKLIMLWLSKNKQENGFKVDKFNNLCKDFQVSRQAMGTRLVRELGIWRAIIFGVRWTTKNSQDLSKPAWRVMWAEAPDDLRNAVIWKSIKGGPIIRNKIPEMVFDERKTIISTIELKKIGLPGIEKLGKKFSNSKVSVEASISFPERVQMHFDDNIKDPRPNSMKRYAQITICVPLDF
ncbi:MAG: ImmA/IrrE family metallo-endopeptidase [Anaerolineales bacterium]